MDVESSIMMFLSKLSTWRQEVSPENRSEVKMVPELVLMRIKPITAGEWNACDFVAEAIGVN